MPHSPDDLQRRDAQHDDDALDHVVRNLFDGELQALAFGRPSDEAGQRRAAAATRELARRAAEHAARSGEPTPVEPTGATGPTTHPLSHPSAPGSAAARPLAVRVPGARPWWMRAPAIVVAGILILVGVTSIGPLLPTAPVAESSLDVFDRAASADERELRSRLLRDGLRVSFSPRIIAEEADAQVIAYRVIVTSTTERSRSEICVLLADERGFGWPSCADRAEVERSGLRTTLAAGSARYFVQWGPVGPPTVSVLPIVGAAPEFPQSPAAELFLGEPPRQDETAYAGLLRTLHPEDRLLVRVLGTTERWEAVGALVASADTERWSYCVHLFERAEERRAQLGASVTCAGLSSFERDGVVAQARAADSGVRLEWRPDGTVFMDDASAPVRRYQRAFARTHESPATPRAGRPPRD
ncbi:MAG: hypothetical protein RJQ01_00680 [Microcella sp.]|uniref:hypothetical protein n=1 Tax=Microcella sp. TaxID=1913979 RepID=UPI0033154AED